MFTSKFETKARLAKTLAQSEFADTKETTPVRHGTNTARNLLSPQPNYTDALYNCWYGEKNDTSLQLLQIGFQ